jgi:spermidine synthase
VKPQDSVSEYREFHSEGSGIFFKVQETLHTEMSPFQEIKVIRTEHFGRVLLLDDLVMLTERDEFVYHEMLVHPPLLSHPEPKDVLIVGGGDGGTLREVLKHDVRSAALVEIDERVCEVSRRFFPELTRGFQDPRAELRYEDGTRYVKETDRTFDVVLVDSTDPVDHAEKLFGAEFYGDVKRCLRPNGILVAQTESPVYHLEFIGDLSRLLAGYFKGVHPYLAAIPTYPGGLWSFTFATDEIDPREVLRDAPQGLKYYNPEIHRAAFALPTYLKNVL